MSSRGIHLGHLVYELTEACNQNCSFCCNHSPFILGNIWERSIREILEDESIRSRYSSIPDECFSCRLYPRCKGGCRAASEQLYGSFSRVDPVI